MTLTLNVFVPAVHIMGKGGYHDCDVEKPHAPVEGLCKGVPAS